MDEPQVTLNPESLSPVEEKLRGPLEDQLTSALQAATERVSAGYSGASADQVSAELLEQTRAGLHPDIAAGWQPDPAELRRVADAIVRGEHIG